MIKIQHIDVSAIHINEYQSVLEEESTNSIYIKDGSFWINAETVQTAEDNYKATILFDITKQFIQELKALVMVMENTYEEKNND